MIIKVCGLCHPENIREVTALDIDWTGFIFYHKSKRQLTMDNGQLIIDNGQWTMDNGEWRMGNCQLSIVNCQLKRMGNCPLSIVNCQLKRMGNCPLSIVNCQLKRVGVFVNASVEEMREKAAAYRLDYLQLHGDEPPSLCRSLQEEGFALIKAFPVATVADLEQTSAYEGLADCFLFDTRCEGYGGSGRSFNWELLHAYNGATPFLLSGGINPGSVEAIRRFRHPRFAGIDLNSGFETEPGLKDIAKLRTFISTIRSMEGKM